MTRHLLTYLIAAILLLGCKDKKELPEDNVYDIRQIGELSTTEYTITKVIKLDDQHGLEDIWEKWDDVRSWTKFGDRKILISCRAKVKAGVDLSKIGKDDILVNGSTITIILPPAEITNFSIEPKDVHTEVESVSWFRDHFTQEEKNDFLKQGEEAIRRDLENSGIYENATDEAEIFIQDFYKRQGFEKVIIRKSE